MPETMLEPVLTAPWPVQIHILAATGALVLSPIQLLRRRGDPWHRALGTLWVASLATAAASSFLISGFAVLGPFGPIHLLSIYVLFLLARALTALRRGDAALHGTIMRNLVWWGLVLPGLLALLPSRLLGEIAFDESGVVGFIALVGAVILIWTVAAVRRRRRLDRQPRDQISGI